MLGHISLDIACVSQNRPAQFGGLSLIRYGYDSHVPFLSPWERMKVRALKQHDIFGDIQLSQNGVFASAVQQQSGRFNFRRQHPVGSRIADSFEQAKLGVGLDALALIGTSANMRTLIEKFSYMKKAFGFWGFEQSCSLNLDEDRERRSAMPRFLNDRCRQVE
jgi:hypothetical protein